MKNRIEQLCNERGMKLTELAEAIDMRRSSLIRSLETNPTLSTLQKVAAALKIDLVDLFEKPDKEVAGYVEVNNTIHKITSKEDLEKVLDLID